LLGVLGNNLCAILLYSALYTARYTNTKDPSWRIVVMSILNKASPDGFSVEGTYRRAAIILHRQDLNIAQNVADVLSATQSTGGIASKLPNRNYILWVCDDAWRTRTASNSLMWYGRDSPMLAQLHVMDDINNVYNLIIQPERHSATPSSRMANGEIRNERDE
jgi:hypothetical protein